MLHACVGMPIRARLLGREDQNRLADEAYAAGNLDLVRR